MNDKKFCFIICVNNREYLNECISYIQRLVIPDGFEIDLLTIEDCDSMAKGYNEAMEASDAKYKVYMHQDTYICNVNYMRDVLDVFSKDDKIGALGIKGGESFLANEITRPIEMYGEVLSLKSIDNYHSKKYKTEYKEYGKIEGEYVEVNSIFSQMFVTKVDLPWEDLFEKDWKNTTVIHSLKMLEKGYKLVIPKQDEPWCIHDGNNWGYGYSKKEIDVLKQRFPKLIDDNFSKRILCCNTEEIKYSTIMFSLYRMGYNVENYYENMSCIEYEEEASLRLEKWLRENDYMAVITFDFARTIAEAAKRANTKYLSWAWDSPLMTYYFPEAKYDTNYVFMFDKPEVEKLKNIGLKNVYHMPLVTDTYYASGLVISDEDEKKYSHDISFIGQMYCNDMKKDMGKYYPSEYVDKVRDIFENETCDWHDYNKLYNLLNKDTIDAFYTKNIGHGNPVFDEGLFYNEVFRNVAYYERVKVLNALAEKYKVDIYTKGDTGELKNVNIHGVVHSTEVAPKIFHLSKINLNVTIHCIRTGAPLRIFDIMGVGGFVLSNYQEELSELFVEDKEIVLFKDIDEMIDKAGYYLTHEKARAQIAINGYKRVSKDYNYIVGLEKILKLSGVE